MFPRLAWLAAIASVGLLYFSGLNSFGLIGPDEPRYASIGREMALSGDWVTPRLWGEPWFEKPALLYWMAALGRLTGLDEELGPRLPVAALSAAFLVFYFLALRHQFGARPASYATLILATTAGWVAFSQVAVTDLPMSALFAASMLMTMRWIDTGERWAAAVSGALMGGAALAKGLVPLVLAVPLVWFARRRLRGAAPAVAAFALVAAPWYALCWLRNGQAFVDEFFLRHHFERYSSDSLAHPQPFWFFAPVLAAGLFPWTPLLVHLCGRAAARGWPRQLLAAWAVFGFLFFSASANKLPGYLLPVLPAVCALMGIAVAEARRARWTLAASALLLTLVPAIAGVLPDALLKGLRKAEWAQVNWAWGAPAVAAALAAWRLDRGGRRMAAILSAGLLAAVSWTALKLAVAAEVDARATARPLWHSIAARRSEVCVGEIHRAWRYGLNYYSIEPLPDCAAAPRAFEIRQEPGNPAVMISRHPDL